MRRRARLSAASDSMCDMHCYLIPKHTLNLDTIGRAVPELKVGDQFLHP